MNPGNPLDNAGSKVGISFNNSRNMVETMDAHRVIEWCKKVAPDKHDALMEVMFRRYFQEAANITDHGILCGIVKEVPGLNEDDCAKMLAGSDLSNEVKSGVSRAKQLKVSGVPFFILEPALGAKSKKSVAFSGAQPPDVIQDMLRDATP